MKKIASMILSLSICLCLILSGCSFDDNGMSNENVSKENLKIGFAHFSDPSDQGYTYNHDCSTWKMAEELGLDKNQIINKYNVPDTAQAATVFRELAEDGCQIIFSTSHGHEDYLIEVAAEYPNITFCHFNGVKAESCGLNNVHNFFGEISQVRYLSGIVAGLSTKTNTIGYVAAMNYAEVNNGMSSYYLGAKSVNPDIKMYGIYLNEWYNPPLEGQATQSLIDKNCDVISQHADSTSGATTCQEKGALYIPYNTDMSSVAPDSVITSVRWDTSSYLIMVVDSVLNHKKEDIPVDYSGTIENGMIYLADINYSLVDDTTAKKVEEAIEESTELFKKKELNIFVGPLKDIEGNTVLDDGEIFKEPKSAPSFGYVLKGINII